MARLHIVEILEEVPNHVAPGREKPVPNDPVAGTFSAANSLATARQYFTATVIGTGVLEAGGLNSSGQIAGAEQYQGSAFVPSDTMAAGRDAHTATLLAHGSVLIASGQDSCGASIPSVELFVVIPQPGWSLRRLVLPAVK